MMTSRDAICMQMTQPLGRVAYLYDPLCLLGLDSEHLSSHDGPGSQTSVHCVHRVVVQLERGT